MMRTVIVDPPGGISVKPIRCFAAASLVVGLTAFATTGPSRAEEVAVQGVLVHAGLNNQESMQGVVQGCVSFMVNIPLENLIKQLHDPNTLGKLSPNITNFKASKLVETPHNIIYEVEEEIVPTQGLFGTGNLAPTKISLLLTIDKAASHDNEALSIRWELDPNAPKTWERFSGLIHGVNLRDGHSMLTVATSSKSQYEISEGVRMKLVEHYLADSKDNLIKWLKSLDVAPAK
jgi:hypothetical protein